MDRGHMRGIDVSFSRVSPDWCRIRRLEGFELFIQCLWLGGYQRNPDIRAVARANLKDAREAGFITAGYLNSQPWFEAAISLAEARRNAGAEWDSLTYVFNDVEIEGVTEAQIKEHCEAITAAGKRTGIYSAKWFWTKLGNPQWPWLLEYPLWAAQYDGKPSAPVTLFGPWLDIIGKQYQGTTNLDGVEVDLNQFDARMEDDDMAFGEDERNKLNDIYAKVNNIWAQDNPQVPVVGILNEILTKVKALGPAAIPQEIVDALQNIDASLQNPPIGPTADAVVAKLGAKLT